MNKFAEMIPFEKAISIFDSIVSEIDVPIITIPVKNAAGCFLRQDIVSQLDLPPFNKSAVDGYAIMAGDERDAYQLLEIVAAGSVGSQVLKSGTTVKVMTGAPVPKGAGKMVMVEHTAVEGNTVKIIQQSSQSNICLFAEDVRKGQVILKAGRQIDEVDISTIISCGITEIEVSRPVNISILVTGDELVDSFENLEMGKIMNSNGPMLSTLAKKYGLNVVMTSIVRDNPDILKQKLQEALNKADITVLSGGVSVGDFDYVLETMESLGLRIHFNKVAEKPGKPMTFASKDNKIVLGLPGNPVSAYVTFHLYAFRGYIALSGGNPQYNIIHLPLANSFKRKKSSRKEFIPCNLNADGRLDIIEYHGSGHLSALLKANGFFVVPVGTTNIEQNEIVDFIPFNMKGYIC